MFVFDSYKVNNFLADSHNINCKYFLKVGYFCVIKCFVDFMKSIVFDDFCENVYAVLKFYLVDLCLNKS